jgi:hypothetical protein
MIVRVQVHLHVQKLNERFEVSDAELNLITLCMAPIIEIEHQTIKQTGKLRVADNYYVCVREPSHRERNKLALGSI